MEDDLTIPVHVWCSQCGEETDGVIVIHGLRWIETVDGFFLTVDGVVCTECFGKTFGKIMETPINFGRCVV